MNHKYVGHLVVLAAYAFIGLRRVARRRSTTCSSTDPIRAGCTRTCAASDRSSGRGSGSSSTGPRGRCCSRWPRRCFWVRGTEIGVGVAAAHSHAAASRAAPRASPLAATALVLPLGGVHLLQHERPERVRDRRRPAWRGARSTSVATVGTTASAAAAHRHQPASRDLPRSAGGRDPRHVRSREHERRRDRLGASRDRSRRSRPERSASIGREARARRRRARPPHLRLGDAARAGRLAAARFRGAFRAARLHERAGSIPPSSRTAPIFRGSDWLPAIGYQADRELEAPATGARIALRRAPRDALARRRGRAARRERRRARVAFDAVFGTVDRAGRGRARARCAARGRSTAAATSTTRPTPRSATTSRSSPPPTRCAKRGGSTRRPARRGRWRSRSFTTRRTRGTSIAWCEACARRSTT